MENSVKKAEADYTSTLIQYFESAEMATDAPRKLSERDRDYYDGKQLTDTERKTIAERGQPPIVNNRIKRKINFLTGLEKQQRTDPRAFPRNPQDENAAEAATDALRYVCEKADFEQTASSVWENMLVEGFGGAELVIKQPKQAALMGTSSITPQNPTIDIIWWPWDRLGYDPHSTRADFSDANYTYGVTWMDYDDAVAKYPDGKDALETSMASSSDVGSTSDDKPKSTVWADGKRKRVRIVQMYYRRGNDWHWCIFTKGGKLKGGPVPFKDEEGESFNPMILQSLYVDRDNNRYGEVRDMIDPQDEINKRRSKLLHLMNVRQMRAEKGAFDDPQKARQELAKPDGFIESNQGFEVEILRNDDQTQGQFALLEHASNELDLMGPNASSMGKGPGDQSGRAILAQQQGGMVELATASDRLRHFRLRVYRGIWALVKQYWTAEQWIRVTDNENKPKFVGLNQPVSYGQKFIEDLQAQGATPEQIQAEQQQIANDPRAQMPVPGETQNNVGEMDMDIIVQDVPDTVNIAGEQFKDLVSLASAGVMFPPEIYIRASTLHNKDELLETLSGGQPGQEQQGPTPEQQAQAQGDQHAQQLAAAQAGATHELEQQKAAAKDQADREAAQLKAQTEQMKVKTQAQSDWQRALLDARTKIEVARISSQAKADQSEFTDEVETELGETMKEEDAAEGEGGPMRLFKSDPPHVKQAQALEQALGGIEQTMAQVAQVSIEAQQNMAAMMQQITQVIAQTAQLQSGPKEVVRDANGTVTGIRPVLN